MHEEGDRLIIKSAQPESLLAVLATLAPLDEEFWAMSELPVDPVEL